MAWFDWDYVIRLIQQSQDKKGLLTHIIVAIEEEKKNIK